MTRSSLRDKGSAEDRKFFPAITAVKRRLYLPIAASDATESDTSRAAVSVRRLLVSKISLRNRKSKYRGGFPNDAGV